VSAPSKNLPERAAPLFEEFFRAVPSHSKLAHAKDVPILAAAIGAGVRILVTHNVRHFRSGEGEAWRKRDMFESRRRPDSNTKPRFSLSSR